MVIIIKTFKWSSTKSIEIIKLNRLDLGYMCRSTEDFIDFTLTFSMIVLILSKPKSK